MKQAKKRTGTDDPGPVRPELKKILEGAEADFNRAQEELYRPSTDVVAYSACFFSRRSLHQYLYYYYKKYDGPKSDHSPHDLTVLEMAEYCARHNDKIAQIEFEHMTCCRTDVLREDEVFYCNEVEKVNSCKNLALRMREVVLSDS